MKRSDFLKTLGIGAGGIILPANNLLSSKPVKVYDNYVRGLQYFQYATIKNQLKENDPVELLREPENLQDKFAIQVNFNQLRLGYIAAFENVVLANMMDAGVELSARISQINLLKDPWRWLAIEVYANLIIQLIDLIESEYRADDANDLYRKSIF